MKNPYQKKGYEKFLTKKKLRKIPYQKKGYEKFLTKMLLGPV